MSENRTAERVHDAVREDIADLVTRRALPTPALPLLDPFLFLNHHGPQVYPPRNQGLPFGPHPHRGFETVTVILAGDIAHHDSGGHESVIGPGGVQWMTAGSGLVHSETSSADFMRDGGPLEILQLWHNLPASLKMTAPRYVGLDAAMIPRAAIGEGVEAAVFSGTIGGVKGPFEPLTPVTLATLHARAGGRARIETPAGHTVFFYVVRGAVRVGGRAAHAFQLVELAGAGAVSVEADQAALILFGHAAPYGEPVVSYGPFVMTSKAEIARAIADYQAGKFG